MKGLVFTEFLDFVEEVAGDEVVDHMICEADPPSGGVYTSAGRYEFSEMAALVGALSNILGQPGPILIRAFGRHLFGRLVAQHPHFLHGVQDPLDFLETVEGKIHVEVLKLYPDAELPSLKTRRVGPDKLDIEYVSCRPLGELCLGLIDGCAAHFHTPLEVSSAPRESGLRIAVRRRAPEASGEKRVLDNVAG